MKAICAALTALAVVAAGPAAAAAPNALVEAVQMPAWVERADARLPLAPGMRLADGDRLHTGAGSRLLLKMREGSLVKLGENATLTLERMGQGRDRVFDAALKVLQGAFRFTTAALRATQRRNINITIATLTAGVRGTDVWGKATSEKDIVCLIEGSIEVQRGAEQPFRMDQPLSFYVAPRGAPALPVAPVDPKQLKIWAAETEIAAGAGAARRGGKWKVIAASTASAADARALRARLRAAGYAAKLRPATLAGKRGYEVFLPQLPTRTEAEVLAAAVRGKMGVAAPRVAR